MGQQPRIAVEVGQECGRACRLHHPALSHMLHWVSSWQGARRPMIIARQGGYGDGASMEQAQPIVGFSILCLVLMQFWYDA